MRVLVAMSGGVDSSVAAARLVEDGHEVVGATLKLWGGPQSSGCCSVADVEDARRVAQQLGIDHHVFNMTDDFEARVVTPYVDSHARGETPNPCIECNRLVKFDLLLERARRLGFDRLATGHHAQVSMEGRRYVLRRGADLRKDQSYVVSMLTQRVLERVAFPVGSLTKPEVREAAARLGLATAAKPDSQDVCFIHAGTGRRAFLAERVELHPGDVVDDETGEHLGKVPAIELVTVGQRHGIPASGARRYALGVDIEKRRVRVARASGAHVGGVDLDPRSLSWVTEPPSDGVSAFAQSSAHGVAEPCVVHVRAAAHDTRTLEAFSCRFRSPGRPVAPGQTVALYDGRDPDVVVGSGIALRAGGFG